MAQKSTITPPRHLYSGSFDRSLKLFDLSPNTMGYVETLFGHQAPVLSIDSLMRETAVSVGGRDKSVRYWKIPEESQLVFRGGGKSGWEDVLAGNDDEMDVDGVERSRKGKGKQEEKFMEGSIECVAMIDENTFVSGGDSGSICLWTTQRKKPVFTQALAHGFDESQTTTDDPEIPIVRKPRYITALASLRYSDLFVSGSWDGEIRFWKLDSKLRSFSLIGSIPALGVVNTLQILSSQRQEVDKFTWVSSHHAEDEEGGNDVDVNTSRRKGEKSLLLVAGVGKEMKFGRWVEKRGEGVLNGALVVAVHPRTLMQS
ncbi:hypothetical protein QCA50_013431 [Cerrena zonata]|uniref:WD40 repeat-like protein n=1 Tax=Cerrena zonata TaxID=2478898 RepID=A0AAW0FRB7_9APHY